VKNTRTSVEERVIVCLLIEEEQTKKRQ